MTIDPASVGLRIMPADVAPARAEKSSDTTFSDTLHDAISQVDTLGLDARYKASNLVAGTGGDVSEVMIAVEKADLSFQLMLQVRNKVVQAYQQIANMQF